MISVKSVHDCEAAGGVVNRKLALVLITAAKCKITYLDYDWSLNERYTKEG